ncbi:MAG: VaFE repeat-containing surface-anchored protein [Corynebacterium sp.]|uniref:VaFE repeat-containing surface-anchored protein n=1 Tax=Corynebacterium sp. TaxID=1720 RepID=UPI0026DB62E6|nr:VaFE repeat-containing surface-anchored protein [Corynebacterium sp.]MDO4761478.1 VaFE repeat-containing surface-anchored protein [Corynebacterium sp.]
MNTALGTKITRLAIAILAVAALGLLATPIVDAQTDTSHTVTATEETLEPTPTPEPAVEETTAETTASQSTETTEEPKTVDNNPTEKENPPTQPSPRFRRSITFDQFEELNDFYGPSTFDQLNSHRDVRAIYVQHDDENTALDFLVRQGGELRAITITAPRGYTFYTRDDETGRNYTRTHEDQYRVRLNGNFRNGRFNGTTIEGDLQFSNNNTQLTITFDSPLRLNPNQVHRIEVLGDEDISRGWGIDLNYAPPASDAVSEPAQWIPHATMNPEMPQRCGLDIALLFDLSLSVNRANGLEPLRDAGLGVINGLKGTGSRIGIYNFGSGANTRPSVKTQKLDLNNSRNIQDLTRAVSAIVTQRNVWEQGSGTNWEAGLATIPLKQPGTDSGYDVVYLLTDGLPTTNNVDNQKFDSNATKDLGTATHQADLVRAVHAANRLKQTGTRIVPLLINVGDKSEWIIDDKFHTDHYANRVQNRYNIPRHGRNLLTYHIDRRRDQTPYINTRDGVTRGQLQFFVSQNTPRHLTPPNRGYVANVTQEFNVWRAGVRTPRDMAADISSDDAPVVVDNFSDLVESAKATILDNCLGTVTIKKRVYLPNGEPDAISEGKGFSFRAKTQGLPRLKDPHDPMLFVPEAVYTTYDDRAEVSISIRSTDVNQKGALLNIYELVPDGFALLPQEVDGAQHHAVCEKVVEGVRTPYTTQNIVDPHEKKNKGFEVIAGSDGFIVCEVRNIRLQNLNPTITTEASFEENRNVKLTHNAPASDHIYDDVTINHIVPGKEYMLRSWLVDKETGAMLSTEPTEITFTSESDNFTVTGRNHERDKRSQYWVSGRLKVRVEGAQSINPGTKAVVFSELYAHHVTAQGNAYDRQIHSDLPWNERDGLTIVSHQNLEDTNQTVSFEYRQIQIGVRKFGYPQGNTPRLIRPDSRQWLFDLYQHTANGALEKIGTLDQHHPNHGWVLFSLPVSVVPGRTYSLVEVKAPEGHELLAEPISFTVGFINAPKRGNQALRPWATFTGGSIATVYDIPTQPTDRLVINVTDVRRGTLPLTGGHGVFYPIAGGILLLIFGAAYYYHLRRRA